MKSNINSINEYLESRRNEGLKEITIYNLEKNLLKIDKVINKDFKEIKEKDIRAYIKPLKQGSKLLQIANLKTFYRFLYRLEKDDKLPECIRLIKIKKPDKDEIEYRKRIITENEYNLIMKYSSHPKHKALIETLYHFGTRKGEVRSIKANGVEYNDGITKIIVEKSKTKTRDTIFEGRLENLLTWCETLNQYKDDENTYLFYGHDPYKKYSVDAINKLLSNLCKRIPEINRKITVHDFRHTAITNFRKTTTPQTFIEENTGLVHGSEMMRIYDHNKIKDYEDYIKNKNDEVPISYPDLKNKQQKEINILRTEMKEYQDVLAESIIINMEYMKTDIEEGNTNFWSNHKDKLDEIIKVLKDK